MSYFFIWLTCLISYILFNEPIFVFIPYLLYWFYFSIKLFKGKAISIELFFVFLSVYLFMGSAYFVIEDITLTVYKYVEKAPFYFDSRSKKTLTSIYSLFLLPCYFVSMKRLPPLTSLSCDYYKGETIGKLASCFLLINIIYASYIYKILGGKYIFWSDLSASYFNLLGWFTMISTAFIVAAFTNSPSSKRKLFYFLVFILLSLMIALHIRLYAVAIVFALLLNAEIRGFRLNAKWVSLLAILLSFIVLQSVLRFQKFDFSDFYNLTFTILGEFILPHISSYYLIIDPLYQIGGPDYLDIFKQFLPTSIRPVSSLYEIRTKYLLYNVDIWPVGGIFFIGQLYYFFGLLSFPLFSIFIIFMSKLKSNLIDKQYSILLVMLPSIFMILPRMELWTIRVSFIGFLLIMALKIIFHKRCYHDLS